MQTKILIPARLYPDDKEQEQLDVLTFVGSKGELSPLPKG